MKLYPLGHHRVRRTRNSPVSLPCTDCMPLMAVDLTAPGLGHSKGEPCNHPKLGQSWGPCSHPG